MRGGATTPSGVASSTKASAYQRDTGRYQAKLQKGERLLDQGEAGHLLEGLSELDPGLGVDAVALEAVGDKA